MSVEEGVTFLASEPALARKIEVPNDLGLGYLTLGQSATTLSGGEAQRIKIAAELGKLQRSKHTVCILVASCASTGVRSCRLLLS